MLEKYALFKVVDVLIKNRKAFSIRDMAREAKISVSTAKASLDYLLDKNILNKKVIGNVHQFNLNNNFLTKQIRLLFSLFTISNSGLIEELVREYEDILSITLYGSLAKGEDNEKSDIDLLIILRKKIEISNLKNEKKLNRELNYLVYTFNEWREKVKNNRAFYESVIINGVCLYGELPIIE